MTTAIHLTRTEAQGPIRGFRADSDPHAPIGTDGLTDGERRELADSYRAEFATFSREAYAKAHALKLQMQKRAAHAELA